MKKSLLVCICSIVFAAVGFQTSPRAQTVTTTVLDDNDDPAHMPEVPIDIFMTGSQKITAYLSPEMDHVLVQYRGNSILNDIGYYDQELSNTALRNAGYVTPGSLLEMTNAVNALAVFDGDMEPVNGYFDARQLLSIRSEDDKVILAGSGYVDIISVGLNFASATFNPVVSTPEKLRVLGPKQVREAKYVNTDGTWEAVPFTHDDQVGADYLILKQSYIGHGVLMYGTPFANHINGWDFAKRTRISGMEVVASLGNLSSPSQLPLPDPASLTGAGGSFYEDGGKLYGRFPLIELIESGMQPLDMNLYVPVWGSMGNQYSVGASRVFIQPISAITPVTTVSGVALSLSYGDESEVPRDPQTGLFPTLTLPAGKYYVRTTFDRLNDFSQDGNAKGSVVEPVMP